MMKKIVMLVLCGALSVSVSVAKKPDLRVVRGDKDTVFVATHLVLGVTDADSRVTVNGVAAKVFKTGTFGAEVPLKAGANEIQVVATGKNEKTSEQALRVFLKEAPKEQATSTFEIERVTLIPGGQKELLLAEGDVLKVRVKALPGCEVSWLGGMPLFEMTADEFSGMSGIYQGQYKVKANDARLEQPIEIQLKRDNHIVTKTLAVKTGVLCAEKPLIIRTKGSEAYLNYGLGEDRLGGAKIGTIDAGIRMEVVGKVDDNYKVKLSNKRTAYLPTDYAEILPDGYFVPESLTGSWSVRPSEKSDVVTISLNDRLPYTTYQEINPSRVVVDIYGAACNSNWITQYQNLKAIKSVDFRQIEPDVFRVILDLKNDQHWGQQVYYRGNALVIEVKAKPAESLQGMVIGVDAGHGGKESNGAVGISGVKEKDLNLDLAYLFKAEMEKRGAKVVMTRTKDRNLTMSERKRILSEGKIDLLVSFHNNAGGNPLTTGGTSTYYRHLGYRPLTTAILGHLLELGVNNFGNIGNFNFSMNAPIEYPNVLVEALFMSNLQDEEWISDPEFRKRLVDKVVLGLEDFMANQK